MGRLVAEHALIVLLGEGLGELLQGIAELGRDHPHRRRLALGQLRQLIQVLEGQHLRRELGSLDGGVDLLDGLRLTLCFQVAGGALTLGAQDHRLALSLGGQDGGVLLTLSREDAGLLLTLGGLDVRLPAALGGEDHRALLAIRLHLHLHGLLDGRWRINRLQLDSANAQSPPGGRGVEFTAQSAVDRLAGGQRLLQCHATDHVSQRCHRNLLHANDVVIHPVDGLSGVVDLEGHDDVDGHRQVVLGDDRLRREGDHALAGVHPGADPVNEGNEDRDTARYRAGVATKPLDDGRLALGDQGDGFHHDESDESQQN